jgi:TolB-like protein
MIYRLDSYELDTERFELRRGGVVQAVEPQVFALLELLVANRDRLVSKDEINLRVWAGRIVSEAVLSSRIRSARKAIGDDGSAQRLIRTVHNRGFRFVGEAVTEVRAAISQAPAPTSRLEATSGAGRPSIAVLPFQALRADPRHDLLADAVAHDLIVELSRLRWLFVIARGSSFRFRGAGLDLGAVATQLGVRYCLTGSLAIHGRRSIVTAELADPAEGRVIWADRFEQSLEDVLTLRTTIATRIAAEIDVRIPLEEARRAAQMPDSLDAWAAYHRGLWHMFRFNQHDNALAGEMFARAAAADPRFARAHAGLSFTHFQNAFIGYAKDAEAERALAREHALRSIDLDPLDPFSNLTMGRAALLHGDLDGSVEWFERSVELNPNYAFAIYTRGLTDAVSGRGADGERNALSAMALSPLDPLRYAMLATIALSHLVRGDCAAASHWAERAAMSPRAHVMIRVIAAVTHELAGHSDQARSWATAVQASTPGFQAAQFFRAFPFRDDAVRARLADAMTRLAFARGSRR